MTHVKGPQLDLTSAKCGYVTCAATIGLPGHATVPVILTVRMQDDE